MSTSKLPVRPSLESLRKQAKKLARDIVSGNAGAIARARAQLPKADLPLSQRATGHHRPAAREPNPTCFDPDSMLWIFFQPVSAGHRRS